MGQETNLNKRVLILLLLCAPYILFYISSSSKNYFNENVNDLIIWHIEKDHLSPVIEYIKSNNNLEKKFGFGNTLLSVAVRKGNFEIVKKLLNAGADPNARDDSGDNPIIEDVSVEACYGIGQENRLKIVELLIQSGANVNLRNVNGNSAINTAAQCGNTKLVELLISNGAKVNFISEYRTPLIEAVIHSNNPNMNDEKRKPYIAIVKILVANGANPFDKINNESWGISALDWAKKFNDRELINTLGASQSHSKLIPYTDSRSNLTSTARTLDTRMKALGIKLNPQIYLILTNLTSLYLFLPVLLTGVYGVYKDDPLFLKASFGMFGFIIIGSFILLMMGLSHDS
jgi:ankyrin repeat protein